jgi:hypothetical protein
MEPGLEFLTVTEPIPPDFSTGVVRHPESRMQASAVRLRGSILAQSRRAAEDFRMRESIMGLMGVSEEGNGNFQ